MEVNQPNNLTVIRLKQKLGTKQLPTGELLLDGMQADLISPVGRGVASISPMLAITRLHNASASVSSMRRIISLARDYSHRRTAFGKLIRDHPLHVRTMAEMELECRAGFVLFVEAARLLSLDEAGIKKISSYSDSCSLCSNFIRAKSAFKLSRKVSNALVARATWKILVNR